MVRRRNKATAGRLEALRKRLDYATIKDWHLAITDGGRDGWISYGAIHNYHTGKREPTADYFRKVAERFGVTVEWLVTGQEPEPKLNVEEYERLTALGQREGRAQKRLLATLRSFESLPAAARAPLVDLLVRFAPPDATDRQYDEAARQLWRLIRLPLLAPGARRELDPDRPQRSWKRRGFTDYALQMIPALALALQEGGATEPTPLPLRRRNR